MTTTRLSPTSSNTCLEAPEGFKPVCLFAWIRKLAQTGIDDDEEHLFQRFENDFGEALWVRVPKYDLEEP